jgi:uncharacterized membrane protein
MTTQPVTGQISKPVSETQSWLNLRNVSLFLVVLGLIVTSYLSYVKATDVAMACIVNSVFDCHTVQNSVYSRMFGIPIAYMGLATYIVLGALLLLEKRVALLQEYGVTLIFGISLFAWLYSMWLVYLQFFRIQALCPWCLAHETIITFFFIVAGIRLRRELMS